MKRIACLLLIVAVGNLSLSAQQKHKGVDLEKFALAVSVETYMPVLNMKGSGLGPGAAFHLDYLLKEKVSLSGNFGYNHFLPKGGKGAGSDYQYSLLGGSYFVQPSLHIDLFAGYATYKGKYTVPFGGVHSFDYKGPAVAAGAGYTLAKKFDVSLRFQKSMTVSFIGLSLALRFSK